MLVLGVAGLLATAAPAYAAAPQIVEAWVSGVSSSSARVQSRINPNGLASAYRIEYLTRSAYEANVAGAKEPFAGASRLPSSSDASIGSGASPVAVQLQLFGLGAETAYRYRVVASNSSGTESTAALPLRTGGSGGALPDNRGWEMVSPVDKNGGEVAFPGALAGGGVLQAAAQGGSVTYSSAASFGVGALGAATASQYLAVRGSGGWATQNVTAPLYSSSYDTKDEGVPYRLFSTDLARGLLLNGRRCRGDATGCPVPNPPLLGTDAPAGYQNYYLRESGTGAYTALLGNANAGFLALDPADFELRLAGSSTDGRHPVLSTCAALTANAVEVPLSSGCDPAQPNLYEYSSGGGLSLLNLLPSQGQGAPGATLAAPAGAVSVDGARVYFTVAGNLYLREGSQTKQVDAAAGGGGVFQAASTDGSAAFFTKGGHLWRYLAPGGSATDLTPAGGVAGMLGSSADGAAVYYQDADALELWRAGETRTVASGSDATDVSDYPPATGTSRVTADGTRLLFVSTVALTGYDNKDQNSGVPDSQVFLYDSTGAGSLVCVSCNPTFARPTGPSTIPGAIANGTAPGSIQAYKPRALSADGRRVFFESGDAIAPTDTNNSTDVYQWEAQGTGSCAREGGCVALISDGRGAGGAHFADASADGSDAFFLTGQSLARSDQGAVDLYDARVGGGFPPIPEPIACNGDACQPLPSEPVDPTLTTLIQGPGNRGVRYSRTTKPCKKGKVKRNGKCVRKKRKGAGNRGTRGPR